MGKIVGIYKITNVVNNKCYIGSSKNIIKRWSEHRRQLKNGNHHSKYLQRAYDKYGIENFKYEIICECNEYELLILEQKYFNELMPEYIIHKEAGRAIGFKHSEETKKLLRELSLKQVRRPCMEETKNKISLANKNRNFTEEHKKKLSESHKGKKLSESHKKKLRESSNPEINREIQKLAVISRKKNNKPLSQKRKEEISKNNSVPVVGVDEHKNIVYSFNSYKETAIFLKKSEITLYRIIKNKKKYNNLLWMRKKDFERL
jgi:group I intron endonuclease